MANEDQILLISMKKEIPYQVDWEQISKYLSGEMNEAERIAFEKLIESNPEYANLVASSGKDLELIDDIHEMEKKYDVDRAWSQLHKKISENKSISKSKSGWIVLIRIAAMVIFVFGLGIASYQIYDSYLSPYQTRTTAHNETGQIINLEDGSKIHLNASSKLVYPRSFSKKNERRVTLAGEAFFEIAKNPEMAFIISAEGAEVKVLGTSFNVIAEDENVEVFVETGKVQLSEFNNPGNKLILKKGDFGILQQNELKKSFLSDENYLSWKTRQMVFKEMELKKVAKVIDRTYQVQISFDDPEIMNLRLTSTFDHEPLDIILESLCLTFNLEFEKEGAKILLQKKLE